MVRVPGRLESEGSALSSPPIRWAQSAGNAGMRPATHTAAGSAGVGLAPPVQPVRSKSAPLDPAGAVPAGRGAGGSGEYVHTHRNISPYQFDGRSVDERDRDRNRVRYKTLAQVSFALQRSGDSKEKEVGLRLLACDRWFRRITFPCGTSKLVPYHCDSMFCPECAGRRSKLLQDRILAKIDQKKFDYFFLTLTVKSWEALTREAIDRLIGMFREFRDADDWRDAGIVGGVYSVESTHTRAGWHPHLHVLIEVRKGSLSLDFLKRFKQLWLSITGDSHVLNLKKLHGIDEKRRKVRRIDARSLRELVKYATKAASFSDRPDRVLEFYRAFKNVRRAQAFGSFLGFLGESEEEKTEDPNEFVGCKCSECKWSNGFPSGLFHISQTTVDQNGDRQLKLFAFDSSPPNPPPEPAPPGDNKTLDLFFHQHALTF